MRIRSQEAHNNSEIINNNYCQEAYSYLASRPGVRYLKELVSRLTATPQKLADLLLFRTLTLDFNYHPVLIKLLCLALHAFSFIKKPRGF